MAIPYAKTPKLRPVLLHKYDDLTTSTQTQTPPAAGFYELYPSNDERSKEKQEAFVRLFFARYFDVTEYQMAVAIGNGFQPATDDIEYKMAEIRLSGLLQSLRDESFGKDSYLSELVQHTVELSDFEATVWNLARDEKGLLFAKWLETPPEHYERLDTKTVYIDAKEEHIARLVKSRATTVDRARTAMVHASSMTSSTESEVNAAKIALKHHQDQNIPWRPSLEDCTALATVPPPRLAYAEMTTAERQTFWEKVWSLDVGANMLRPVRRDVNIPATLKQGEFFYKAAFVVFAMDMWRYIYSAEGPVDEDELRDECVYTNIAGVNQYFFLNEEGFELLRLNKTSDSETGMKRKVQPSFASGLNFTKKAKMR